MLLDTVIQTLERLESCDVLNDMMVGEKVWKASRQWLRNRVGKGDDERYQVVWSLSGVKALCLAACRIQVLTGGRNVAASVM